MRKCTALLLASFLLLSLAACSARPTADQGSVAFYYPRQQFQFSSEEKVIVAESRSLSGDRNDPSYLLTLYMLGPLNEELSSPFPSGTSVLDIRNDDASLEITISNLDDILSDAGFSLASSCLAMTLFELTEYETIHIYSGGREIALAREDILLTDDISSAGMETEETR